MSDEAPIRFRAPLADDEALLILEQAQIEVLGRMPWSSNATFLVDLRCDETVPAQGIYKPERGERPLWDFPSGLHEREIATYRLSRQLGWRLVPPTVERDGPLGLGSLQLFVPSDFEQHYFNLLEEPRHHPTLQRLCVLDILANSTDRKAGHCLLGDDQHVWAIDNGLTFHAEFKLRTVIWDWGGDHIPQSILDDVAALVDAGLDPELAELLDRSERDAVLNRARAVLSEGRFPVDPTGRRHPWPLV